MSTDPNPDEKTAPHPAATVESATVRNPVPDEEVARLRELRAQGADASTDIDLLCAQLRKRGYTDQAIANALGVTSRWAIGQRIKRVPAQLVEDIEPEVSRLAPKPEPEPTRAPETLTYEEVARLLELQPLASKNRAGTVPNSPVGLANAEYVTILLGAHDRGVTDYMAAKQLGQTPPAITSKRERANGTAPTTFLRTYTGRPGPLEGFDDDVTRLRGLLEAAEVSAGYGPLDPNRLVASHDFDEALATFIRNNPTVSFGQLASSLERSRSALAMRIANILGTREALPLVDEPDFDDQDDTPVDRQGHLTNFTPETVPDGPPADPDPVVVNLAAQRASTNDHMDTLRRLREAVVAGGHTTTSWNLGQDACFTHGSAVVNIEVKSIGGGVEQYRLGVGQLAEQMQHHLDHVAAGTSWYRENEITRVVGILVVTSETIPGVWRRLAPRLGIAIWDETTAIGVFTDRYANALPVGVSVEDRRTGST